MKMLRTISRTCCPSSSRGLNDKQPGMAAMSDKFRQMGNEVYDAEGAVKESNKAL